MNLIRKLISSNSTPIEQETVVIGDDRNSLITQESDFDNELEHDELQPERRQRNTEQGTVMYGQEQGSSSNSTLSLLFNWPPSIDSSLNEMRKTLVEKLVRLCLRRSDVGNKLKYDENQPSKRRSEEVHHWLISVEKKKNEILSMIQDSQGSSSHSNLSAGRIQKFIEQIDDLYQMGLFPNGLVLEDQLSTKLPLFLGTKPVGIKFQKNIAKILGWLRNEKNCIIGVYGMGGVGKTTLLEQIHDQLLKDASLDGRVYWVKVSQSFSMDKLQQDIANEPGIKCFEESNEKKRARILYKLQQDIAKELGIKNFEESSEIRRRSTLYHKLAAMDGNVLILDDMWKDFSVSEVGIPVEVEGSGCKVILSTRSREVCKKMGCKNLVIKVQILSDEEAWGLFVDKLGHYNTLEEEEKKIARSIAKECGGLPLAIITMACSMRDNVDINDWKAALNEVTSLPVHPDMKDKVLEVLKYSYDRIGDDRIQNCFLSCILFGEDVDIRREDLIDMWINEGLFDEIESREYQVAKGHSILNKLESWCLLESCLNYFEERYVKMHDLVRDMAFFITQSHPRFLAKARKNLDKVPKDKWWSNDLVKVSLSHNFITEIPSGMAPKTTNLTVLMLNSNKKLKEIPELFFQHMKTLKVLDLSFTAIERVPQSVSDLVNLRALLLHDCGALRCVPESFFQHMKALKVLDLSGTSIEKVPESVSELENLRALLLNNCEKLEYVPSVTKLTKLRVLALNKCYELKAAPRGLERLKSVDFEGYCPWDISNMRDFSKFILQSSWSSLTSFHFWIRDPALFTKFYYSEIYSRVVKITGWEYREEESSWMLPNTVEYLEIEHSDFKGRSLRDVFPSLDEATNLEQIRLSICGNMKVVFSFTEHLPHLPNLESLCVYSCKEVEEIFQSNERASQCVSPPPQSNPIILSLPNLKKLELGGLPKLKWVLPITGQLHLPNLNYLTVMSCEDVKEIFHSNDGDSQSNPIILSLPNLVELDLFNLPKLKWVLPITEKLHLPKLKELLVTHCEEVEEIIQIYNPNLGLPNLERLILKKLPKLKRVFPFTEQLHQLQNLEELTVEACEEVEEIFQIYNPNLGKLKMLKLKNLPKLKWVFPFTEHFISLFYLESITVLNCAMLRSICRGLILSLTPSNSVFSSFKNHVENCPKLKAFQFKEGIIIVDSKSTTECILNNTQYLENLQQDYPHRARVLSDFINERLDCRQGLDDDIDEYDDGGYGDGDGTEDDVDDDWGASLSLLPLEWDYNIYNQEMELWQGLDDNNGDDGDGAEGDVGGDVDGDETTWGVMLSLLP